MTELDSKAKAEIEKRVQAYRARAFKEASAPPRPTLPPEDRLREALERTEVQLGRGDIRRVQVLQRMAGLMIKRGDWAGARGAFMEAVHMCELAILGLSNSYPVISTLPPPPRTGLTTLPASTERDDEPDG